MHGPEHVCVHKGAWYVIPLIQSFSTEVLVISMLVKVHEFNHSCLWGHRTDPFAELCLYVLIEALKLYRASDLSRHGTKDL